jgi:hypothetical protein
MNPQFLGAHVAPCSLDEIGRLPFALWAASDFSLKVGEFFQFPYSSSFSATLPR